MQIAFLAKENNILYLPVGGAVNQEIIRELNLEKKMELNCAAKCI